MKWSLDRSSIMVIFLGQLPPDIIPAALHVTALIERLLSIHWTTSSAWSLSTVRNARTLLLTQVTLLDRSKFSPQFGLGLMRDFCCTELSGYGTSLSFHSTAQRWFSHSTRQLRQAVQNSTYNPSPFLLLLYTGIARLAYSCTGS